MRDSQDTLRAVPTSPGEPRSPVWPVVVLGTALGAGQVWGGLYSLSIWGPVALVVAACLVGLLVSRPAHASVNALVVLGALVGLAGLSAVSLLWAESGPQASLDAHRWALYAGLLGILLLVVRDMRQRHALLVSVGAASIAVALGITLILAAGDASRLFFSMRLMEPLGYVNGQAAALAAALWPALAVAEGARRAAARGAGAGVACLVCGLLLLVQSRGAMLALVVAIGFVMLAIPGRLRRAWLVVFVGVGVAAVAGSLLGVYSSPPSVAAQPADDVVHRAVRLLVVASAACGVAWALATGPFGAGRPRSVLLHRLARWGMIALIVGAVAGGLATSAIPSRRSARSCSGSRRSTPVSCRSHGYWPAVAIAMTTGASPWRSFAMPLSSASAPATIRVTIFGCAAHRRTSVSLTACNYSRSVSWGSRASRSCWCCSAACCGPVSAPRRR